MANALSSTKCYHLPDAVSPLCAKIVLTCNTLVHPCDGEVGVGVNPNLKDFLPAFCDSSDIVLSQPVVSCKFCFINFILSICYFYFSPFVGIPVGGGWMATCVHCVSEELGTGETHPAALGPSTWFAPGPITWHWGFGGASGGCNKETGEFWAYLAFFKDDLPWNLIF